MKIFPPQVKVDLVLSKVVLRARSINYIIISKGWVRKIKKRTANCQPSVEQSCITTKTSICKQIPFLELYSRWPTLLEAHTETRLYVGYGSQAGLFTLIIESAGVWVETRYACVSAVSLRTSLCLHRYVCVRASRSSGFVLWWCRWKRHVGSCRCVRVSLWRHVVFRHAPVGVWVQFTYLLNWSGAVCARRVCQSMLHFCDLNRRALS